MDVNVLGKQEEAEMSANPTPTEPPPPYQPSYGTQDAAPPSYDQSPYPLEAPPTYDSVFGQVREARQKSSGITEFFRKFLIIILGTIGCTICVGIVVALPISMIIMGSKYLYQCRAEPFIPIYLIVGGVFGTVKYLSNMCQRLKNRQDQQDEENAKTNPFDGMISCFLCAWFIAGNVWIYRTYGNFDDSHLDAPNYCNPALYWYAFWVTTATYILMATVCMCICCAGVFAAVVGENKPEAQL